MVADFGCLPLLASFPLTPPRNPASLCPASGYGEGKGEGDGGGGRASCGANSELDSRKSPLGISQARRAIYRSLSFEKLFCWHVDLCIEWNAGTIFTSPRQRSRFLQPKSARVSLCHLLDPFRHKHARVYWRCTAKWNRFVSSLQSNLSPLSTTGHGIVLAVP